MAERGDKEALYLSSTRPFIRPRTWFFHGADPYSAHALSEKACAHGMSASTERGGIFILAFNSLTN